MMKDEASLFRLCYGFSTGVEPMSIKKVVAMDIEDGLINEQRCSYIRGSWNRIGITQIDYDTEKLWFVTSKFPPRFRKLVDDIEGVNKKGD